MFINDPQFNWKQTEKDSITLYYKGCESFTAKSLDHVQGLPQFTDYLASMKDYNGGVIETDTHIITWVDHIRSWALFYTVQDGEFYLSNSAFEIQKRIRNPEYNDESLLEFKMSGYVTGRETLIRDIWSLAPGEYLVWDKQNKKLDIYQYFSYIPTFDSQISDKEAIEELGNIFDRLTMKIIRRAQGRRIWIPLSGGLDSRILLCKLHEHGYTNIQTFTYGPHFNFESFMAQKVAKKLGIDWKFVSPPARTLRKYFESDDRKKFWDFAGNLKTMACMREYGTIRYLKEKGEIEDDAIFLNGQSGDYITGNHIAPHWQQDKNFTHADLHDVLIDKHYGLWQKLKTPDNLNVIKNKIDNFIAQITTSLPPITDKTTGAIWEETWEYTGRQICYVANGERVYEYFGYDWEMPLWEKELVDFFKPLSFDMKFGQKIYKDYLQSYNYMGLFPEKEPYIWRWPVPMLWVVPLAQLVGLSGRSNKDKFYALMRYHGHYANQYAFFDWQTHQQTASKTRNVIALYIKQWLKENNLGL